MAVSLAAKPAHSSWGSLILIVGGALILIGGIGYWYISYTSESDEAVVVSTEGLPIVGGTLEPAAPQTELEKEVAEVLNAVAIIKRIQLDTKFFEDSRFTALRDTPIEIPKVDPSGNYQFRFFVPSADQGKKK